MVVVRLEAGGRAAGKVLGRRLGRVVGRGGGGREVGVLGLLRGGGYGMAAILLLRLLLLLPRGVLVVAGEARVVEQRPAGF